MKNKIFISLLILILIFGGYLGYYYLINNNKPGTEVIDQNKKEIVLEDIKNKPGQIETLNDVKASDTEIDKELELLEEELDLGIEEDI